MASELSDKLLAEILELDAEMTVTCLLYTSKGKKVGVKKIRTIGI